MTDADQFAKGFNDGGQRWETDRGEDFAALAERMGASVSGWRDWDDDGGHEVSKGEITASDATRYTFGDGSVIVAHGDGWDHEGETPGTWRG